MTSKKLSEFTAELTELNEDTDRVLVARPGNATDYFCTPATIAALAAGEPGGNVTVPLISAAPTAPPDPLPETGTASLALETSTPPVLWAYDGAAWSFVTMTAQGGGGGGGDADADAFIARLGGTYSTQETDGLNDLVVALKAISLTAGGTAWDALQFLHLRWLDTVADSRLNLKGETYTINDQNLGTFTARQGMALNGTNQAFKVPLNVSEVTASREGIMGAYLRSSTAIGGTIANSNFNLLVETYGSSDLAGFFHDGSNGLYFDTFGTSDPLTGPVSIARNAGPNLVFAVRQVTAQGAKTADEAIANIDAIGFGAYYNTNGTAGELGPGWLEGQFGAVWGGFGIGFTAAEVQSFHAAISDCATAFGAAVGA